MKMKHVFKVIVRTVMILLSSRLSTRLQASTQM